MTTSYKAPFPFALIILDGLGLNPSAESNAFKLAKTPTIDRLRATCPTTELITCGERVGLPAGQMGNSEVGHLNLGAGRVVEQDLLRINNTIRAQLLGQNPAFKKLCETVPAANAVHFIGLLSSGGVHSVVEHLLALVAVALQNGRTKVYVHAITDGRDRPPQAAADEIGEFEMALVGLRKQYPQADVRIVSIIGRYFAMDRDKRWERTKKAYDLFVLGTGEVAPDPIAALEEKRQADAQDEFLEPISIRRGSEAAITIQNGDGLVFYNFRSDRMRQIVPALTDPTWSGFAREPIPHLSSAVTLTEYEPSYKVEVMFPSLSIQNHLGDVVASAGLTQLRAAETEKYPHVTYFFNGGDEAPRAREERIMVPSPRDVATYDLKPEMSARELTDKVIEALTTQTIHVTIINYANCDMVGHTGKLDAAIKAVEVVDECLGRLLNCIEKLGGCALVTADHGNAEQMIDYETREPHTAHTLFPVPLFVFGKDFTKVQFRPGGSLCDISPTICHMLNLPQPKEMTGQSLILA